MPSSSKINLYASKYSPPCQAVLIIAKALDVELNMKVVDLTAGEHLSEDYLKINPAHKVPSIEDNGFILTESRAIMRYLCNMYAPESDLYPKDAKQRATIDQILDFDNELFNIVKEAIAKPLFGFGSNEEKMELLKENLKILNQIIGDKKYFVADHLTIADVSVLATTHMLPNLGPDLEDYPNFKQWLTSMTSEMSFYKEFCDIDMQEMMNFIKGMQALFNTIKANCEE